MNWIDIAILVVMALCIVWGAKSGLVGAALYGAGLLIGWVISGRLSQLIGDSLGTSSSVDTAITVLVYVLVFGASILVTRSVIKLIKPGTILVDVATLGLNRMVGLILGFAIGIIISFIFITALARFTYDFDIVSDVPGASTVTATKFIPTNGIVAKVENTRNSLENGLTQSAITPYIIKIMVNIPANVFGLIPDEYMAPLEILNSKL